MSDVPAAKHAAVDDAAATASTSAATTAAATTTLPAKQLPCQKKQQLASASGVPGSDAGARTATRVASHPEALRPLLGSCCCWHQPQSRLRRHSCSKNRRGGKRSAKTCSTATKRGERAGRVEDGQGGEVVRLAFFFPLLLIIIILPLRAFFLFFIFILFSFSSPLRSRSSGIDDQELGSRPQCDLPWPTWRGRGASKTEAAPAAAAAGK
mmetsp:Transcript_57877/g.126820  ORF Transcript_57877/g.126820 Transcript_57877/m.126820 type:complete len:210 (-) Transcript_57877:559-1188(-)